MQNNTDSRRKRDALVSALFYTLLLAAGAALLLWLQSAMTFSGSVRLILLLAALADLILIVPIWISLRIRFREIDGGEENAAAQY